MSDPIDRRRLLGGTAAGLLGAAAFGAPARAAQPNMEMALGHILEAQIDLRAATPNKGGHRDRAIELLREAERQVRLGIDVGD